MSVSSSDAASYDDELKSQSISSDARKSLSSDILTSDAGCEAESDKEYEQRDLKIDASRLWHQIHHTAQWGAIPNSTGMARLALSDDDKSVRDYFVSEAMKIGCKVQVDEVGNIFAILPGQNDKIPPIGIGSHLDTQPAGGRFDGVLGVLGALEVLRTVQKSGYKTYAPLAAIDWTNEEGARFMPGCNGSAVWAAHVPLSQAHGLFDCQSSRTLVQELRRIGYLGQLPASFFHNPLSGHFELHIEQRCLLQDARKRIGIVKNIQGIRWYRASINGERAHGGSTPMSARGDALVNAAKIILFLERKAIAMSATATVGVLELQRPSANTIPGTAHFTIDIRHPSEAVLDEIEAAVQNHMADLSAENARIECTWTRVWHSPAATFDEVAVACTSLAAAKIVGADNVMDTSSLAGHDSALTALRTPTSMIFVPSKNGISHAPEEWSSKEECATGVQVMLEAVLAFDAGLQSSASRHSKV